MDIYRMSRACFHSPEMSGKLIPFLVLQHWVLECYQISLDLTWRVWAWCLRDWLYIVEFMFILWMVKLWDWWVLQAKRRLSWVHMQISLCAKGDCYASESLDVILAHTDVVVCNCEALGIYIYLCVSETLPYISGGSPNHADFILYNSDK